jgi:ketosteroid isomerase-like protein
MRRILISLIALTLPLAPQLTFGADVDDLKAAHLAFMQALNAKDVDGILAFFHEKAVGFMGDNAFPDDYGQITREQLRQGLALAMSRIETISSIPHNFQYRVVGNTGIAWGHGRAQVKPKDGPLRTDNNRLTFTFIKSGGKWLLLSWHISVMPSGN